MRILLLLLIMLDLDYNLIAQNDSLKKVCVNEYVSTHFVCSEPVQYIDISTDLIVGDLPLSNIVRIKPTVTEGNLLGVLTIVTQQYLAQYEIIYGPSSVADRQIMIEQEDGQSLLLHDIDLSYEEMRSYCSQVLHSKIKNPKKRIREYGIEARLNQIHTVGNYYLVDLTVLNRTKIQYDIDQLRFKISDKKINKATNFQEVEIKPQYQFYHTDSFKKKYRNVFVFKKFTYPNKKVFSIELAEKQISGRNIKLKIDYKQVLKADTF